MPANLLRCAEDLRALIGSEGLALVVRTDAGEPAVGALAGTAPWTVTSGDVIPEPEQEGYPIVAETGALAAEQLEVGGANAGWIVTWDETERPPRRLRRVAAGAGREVELCRLIDAKERAELAAAQARRHLALLSGVSSALSRALEDWEPALADLADVVVPVHADFFAVDLLVDSGTLQRVACRHADEESAVVARSQPVSDGRWTPGMSRAIDGARTVVPDLGAIRTLSASYRLDRGQLSELHHALNLDSWAVIPIRAKGLALGALTVGTVAPRRGLRPSDITAYEELAGRVAVAVERVLLYRQVREGAASSQAHADLLGRAVDAAPLVTASLTIADIAARAADQAVRVAGAAQAVIEVRRPGRDPVVVAWPASAGASADALLAAGRSALAQTSPGRGSQPCPWLSLAIPVPNSDATGLMVVSGPATGAFGLEEESILFLLTQITGAAIGHAERFDAAAANERRVRTLVEASPLAIIELAADGRVATWNHAAAHLLRWDPEATSPGPLHDAAQALLRSRWEQLREGLGVIDDSAMLLRHDGTSVEVSVAAALVGAGPDGARDEEGLLCVMSDVTERQLLERELQQKHRMEALGRLAGGVAHDFNNLLTVIVGYADMVANILGEDHSLFGEVDAIRSAGRRATSFTKQLLAISRGQVVSVAVIDLSRAVADLENVLRPMLSEGVTVDTDLDPDAGRIEIDLGQLEQVILNLVVNARDAMPDGGHLTIATHAELGEAPGAPWAVLEVTDTGVGMDQATIDHCFEPFFTTRRADGGTGLGLATAYGIVEAAGGRISIRSSAGRGTTFEVAFPAADLPLGAANALPAEDEEEWEAERIVLLVEDEDDVRAFARTALQESGLWVLEAANAQQAVEVHRRFGRAIDLLITDVVMPGVNGLELADALATDVPVLFLSGFVEDHQRDQLESRAGSAFLAKPFIADELLHAVRSLLHVAQQPDGGRTG